MSNLSSNYLHLDFELSQAELEEVRQYFIAVAQRYASVVYRQNVQIRVELEQGSIKVWIAIAGSIYLAIGQYGSFRAGIDQLIKDAKTVKEYVADTLVKDGVSEGKIIEVVHRRGVPDKIRHLLLRIDRFETRLPGLTQKEARRESELIFKAVRKIADELDYKEDVDAFIGCLDEKYRPSSEKLGVSYRQALNKDDDYLSQLPLSRQTNSLVLDPPKHNLSSIDTLLDSPKYIWNLSSNNTTLVRAAPLALRQIPPD